jgi:AcrR family transcriptional regulator
MAVDHDKRRARIAEVTASVVASEGLDAAKIRRIAKDLGGPTRNVTYYFANKEELLEFTYRSLLTTQLRSASAPLAGVTTSDDASGPSRLVDCLMAMAATDEDSAMRWRAFLAFWDQAARDPALAELQRVHLRQSFKRIAEIAREAFGMHHDLDSLSMLLDAVVEGISVQVLADPTLWPHARVRAVLTMLVTTLLTRKSNSPGNAPEQPAKEHS